MYSLRKVCCLAYALYHINTILSDNPIAQQLLVKILQRADLTVVATSNGNEAISGTFGVSEHIALTHFSSQNGNRGSLASLPWPYSIIVSRNCRLLEFIFNSMIRYAHM